MEKNNIHNLKKDFKKLVNLVLEDQSSYLHDVLSCLYNFNLKIEYKIKHEFSINVLSAFCEFNNVELINDIPENLIENNSIYYNINANILTLTVNHIYYDYNQLNMIFENIYNYVNGSEDFIKMEFVKTKKIKEMHDALLKFYKKEKIQVLTINNVKDIDNYFDKKYKNFFVVDSKKINNIEKNKKGIASRLMSVMIDKNMNETIDYIKNFDYIKNIIDSAHLIFATSFSDKVAIHNYIKGNYYLDPISLEVYTFKNYQIKYYKKVS